MTEPASKTSNHQRLDEMLSHLTPKGAVVPYNLCIDPNDNFWVSSKGGLFKISSDGSTVLFESRNMFPKKIAPYTQVIYSNGKIIYASTDDTANSIEFQVLDLDGKVVAQHLMDGKVQSLAVNNNGDIFLTKQPVLGEELSCIYKSSLSCLIAWDVLTSTKDFAFQHICAFDDDTLAVATSSLPINLYSKQNIKWISAESGEINSTFSCSGKENGQVFFPRCMQRIMRHLKFDPPLPMYDPHPLITIKFRYKDDLLVMDKTGRFQLFDKSGTFKEVSARIDAYIGNGFVVRGDEAVIVCSGIVTDSKKETLCDDWIEAIKLDGSCWTQI